MPDLSEENGRTMHKVVNVIYAITMGAVFGLLILLGIVVGVWGMFLALLKRIGLMALVLAVLTPALRAQGTVSGSETTITYSGTNAQITNPNTPGTNFTSPNGLNTFILPIPNPSVSIRFYVTNNTVNACPSGFTAQLWAVTDAQTSSFNNALSNWQVIPLQDAGGNLQQALLPSIPASGAVYFSSTAISSPRVALQFINTVAGSCGTTNVEITAVITNVAVTSPLLSANSPTSFNGSTANQVQGVVAQEQNGTFVNPIIQGGLQLPLNGGFLTAGIDNWNSNFVGIPTGASGLVILDTSPAPAQPNELAVGFEGILADFGGTNILAPWVVAPPNSNCSGVSGGFCISFTKNPNKSTKYGRTFSNVQATGQDLVGIVLLSSPTATVRQATITSSLSNNITTLTGSTLLAGAICAFAGCILNPPTDTQGNTYQLLTFQNFNNGLRVGALWIWASTTLSVVGANTVTFSAVSGTIGTDAVVEVTGTSPSSITSLSVSTQVDPTGIQVIRQDAQFPNEFVCSVTISTNTTTQCQQAPTVIGAGGLNVPVRSYVTDFQINTTTAGTATTIQLKTGTGSNCGTATANLSAILYPDTTVGIQSITGTRTPLIAPLQTEVCVTQAGTTAGTVTVEIRGYFAP